MTKKIALIRSSYSPFGGVERTALSIIEGLLSAGARVDLLTWPNQQWPIHHSRLNVVPCGISKGHRLVQAVAFNRSVNRYLAGRHFDVVLSLDFVSWFTHMHAGGGTHQSFLKIKNQTASAPARLFRHFSLFHNYVLHLEKCSLTDPRLQRVRCNSSLVRRDIQKDYQVRSEKLVVIHSSVYWHDIGEVFDARKTAAASLLREENLDPSINYLLFLGSGFWRKGLDIALAGLAALPDTYHLLAVGKGAIAPYRKIAEKLGVAQRVHFLGPRARGWRYGALAKAVVLPSRYEPFGGAAAEGLAMGLPVLVSDETGALDLVTAGQNGVILPTPMTPERIKTAFQTLQGLIESPVLKPADIRDGARSVANDVILSRLMTEFIEI